MNTYDLVSYYADLLILQYIGKPRAYATVRTQVTPVLMPQVTVQTITFSPVPDAGEFVLSFGGDATGSIAWDATAEEIEIILRGIASLVIDGGDAESSGPDIIDGGDESFTGSDIIDGGDADGFGLSDLTVTGSIADGTLTVTFVGMTPPVELLELVSSTLTSSGDDVVVTITETDVTIPVAVQDAFNVIGDAIAVGVQLDVIGKYVGVSRTGQGFSEQITLGDADYLTLIQLAIIKNNSGSSLETIVGLLYQFFGTEIVVYDYTNMLMSYSISSSIGDDDVVERMVTQGLLPKPMAVGLFVVIFDDTNAFGFEGSTDSGGFGDLDDPDVGGKFASLFAV